MKLRNKKTGVLGLLNYIGSDGCAIIQDINARDNTGCLARYNSLAELNKEWEDYEEPKEYWFINSCGVVEVRTEEERPAVADMHKQFGNHFSSREEAEKAVEKLKAWKRLKDNGFKFLDYTAIGLGEIKFEHNVMDEIEDVEQLEKDLDLLFGGEE